MLRNTILLYISVILLSCNTEKRYANYKETVGTITSYSKSSSSNPVLSALITGDSNDHSSSSWSIYSFTVKRKLNEYSPDEGEKKPYYDFTIYGENTYGQIGEKFIIKYDPKAYDNTHSFLVRYKPVFMDNEKTVSTMGKITKIYGKDALYKNAIAIEFGYRALTKDSVESPYIKYQYLVPGLNIDSMKFYMNTGKEFKVLYSPENPKRAIIYYDQK